MGFFDNLLYPKRDSDYPQVSKAGLGVGDLTNQGLTLDIYSLVANEAVSFAAFIDAFSDAYNSEWNSEQVFGRMDPISTFMGTRRAISVSWRIPAASELEARQNLYDVNKLVSFLYPQYAERGNGKGACGATTINMGPLMRIKFGNLIQNSTNGGGLLGYVNGITFEPVMEEGMFAFSAGAQPPADKVAGLKAMNRFDSSQPDPEARRAAAEGLMDWKSKHGGVQYYPKSIRLNFDFTVLHEHPLGFNQSNQMRSGDHETYPYNIVFGKNEKPRKAARPPNAPPTTSPDAIQAAQQQRLLDNSFQAGYEAGFKPHSKLVRNLARGAQARSRRTP